MDIIYYFDRIKIANWIETEKMKQILPVNELRQLCSHFQIDTYSDWNHKNFRKYKSRIDITVPTSECLKKLSEYEQVIPPYAINYLEIARDQITPTKEDATALNENFCRSARKRWGTKHFTFYQQPEYETKSDPNIFTKQTGYSSSKLFGFRSYARYSKVNGLPAFHMEWILKGPATIRQKASIIRVKDLLDFDFQQFFDRTDKQFIQYLPYRIDQIKLGKFLKGISNKKRYDKRQWWSVGCHGAYIAHLCNNNPGELLAYFQKLKREIRKAQGPKTAFQKRVLQLRDIKRFLQQRP